jgi:tetratricopeptide (TPR) repeat protein
MGKREEALALLRQAVNTGLPDKLLFRALWDIGVLEKKLRRPDSAACVFSELATCKNEYHVRALEEMAKHHERIDKNYGAALEFTNRAFGLAPSLSLARRKARLERRLGKGAK